jgi:hypothetical protein
MAKTLREKCVNGDVRKMIGKVEDLAEIWDTLDTCYERQEEYMSEALKPIIEFRRHKMVDSVAIRELFSLLRVAIKSAKNVGHFKLLINDWTIPNIMGKIFHIDWKQWVISCPKVNEKRNRRSLREVRGA